MWEDRPSHGRKRSTADGEWLPLSSGFGVEDPDIERVIEREDWEARKPGGASYITPPPPRLSKARRSDRQIRRREKAREQVFLKTLYQIDGWYVPEEFFDLARECGVQTREELELALSLDAPYAAELLAELDRLSKELGV